MRSIVLSLLTFSFPSPSNEAEIVCKTTPYPSPKHPDLRYGNCKVIDSKYNGSILRIKSALSIRYGDFESTDIDAHTSFSLIPHFNSHLTTPDIYHSPTMNYTFDMRTHYFERTPGLMTLCSPLRCIKIINHYQSTHYLRPIYFDLSPNSHCHEALSLPIGYIGNASFPVGICIDYKKSPKTTYPILFTNNSSVLYYFSLTTEFKKIIIYNHSDEGGIETTAYISPTRHIFPLSSPLLSSPLPSPPLSFFSYDLSSHVDPKAPGFSLSHNLHPLYPNPDRVYSIKTPTRVYSLLKEPNGGFTLFPEPGERTNEVSYQSQSKSYLEKFAERRAPKQTPSGKEGETPLKYEEEPHRKTLIIQTYKGSAFFFKNREVLRPAGRFGTLYREGNPLLPFLEDKEKTGFRALKRFFDLEDAVGCDWRNVTEEIGRSEVGRAVLGRRYNVLYNWLGFLRSNGERRGEGVYRKWTDLISNGERVNWDLENALVLKPPKRKKELPLLEDEPVDWRMLEDNEEEREKLEDALWEAEYFWRGSEEDGEGLWRKHWVWIVCGGVGVIVVTAVVILLCKRKSKQHTDPLLV